MRVSVAFMLSATLAMPLLAAENRQAAAPKPWPQEPSTFMGIDFNKKLEYSLPQCPAGYGIPTAMCRAPAYKQVYSIKGGPTLGSIGSYTLSAYANPDGVDAFYLTTKSENFAELAKIFIAKYGEPTGRLQNTVQTKRGGEFTDDILHWKGKTIAIMMERYDGDINTSSVMIQTLSSLAATTQQGNDKTKDAAGKL
jgi:hypothetical protein